MDLTAIDDLLATPLQVDETSERAAFYLQNRTLIETWVLLRGEAADAVQNAIFDMAGPLQADLRQLGVPDAVLHVDRGKWPVVSLAAPEWRRGPGLSPIQIGIECVKTPIGERGDLRLYAAVIAPISHPMSKIYQPAVAELSVSLRSRLGHEWKANLPRWPVFSYVATTEESWTIHGLVNQAREKFLRLWSVAAPEIDRMMSQNLRQHVDQDAGIAGPAQ